MVISFTHSLMVRSKPPPKPDNSQFIALSVAGAGFFVILATASECCERKGVPLRSNVLSQYSGMPAGRALATLVASASLKLRLRD